MMTDETLRDLGSSVAEGMRDMVRISIPGAVASEWSTEFDLEDGFEEPQLVGGWKITITRTDTPR